MMMRITPLAQLFQQGATTAEVGVTPGNPAYVLLKDIQNVFPTASKFQCDNRMLEFITDGEERYGTRVLEFLRPKSRTDMLPTLCANMDIVVVLCL